MIEEDGGWSTSDGDRSWIATFEGGKVHPLDLRPEQITLEDIARGLAGQARFLNRTRFFYSVAQHSVLCARQAKGDQQLPMLFHDAGEAWPPGDIPRPMKRHPIYRPLVAIQGRNQAMIFAKYRIPDLDPSYKDVDNRMLATEVNQLFDVTHPDWQVDAVPYQLLIHPWTPDEARRTWLGTAMALLAGREQPCPHS